MSWIDDPHVFCMLIPEEVWAEGDTACDPDKLAGITAAQIWPSGWTLLALDDVRFREAVDLTRDKLDADLRGTTFVHVQDRERGSFALTPRAGGPTLVRHLRVIILTPREEATACPIP